ncbi:uncharacterized protein LOC119110004, partial [Pollicipes pollicipes]|uniref:uncharacterized protein LOC119110004 n=1 Tax=Pollicipes pollicipes TaxID=41117 RepID=UPI0018857B68
MNNMNLSKLRAKPEEGQPFWSVSGMGLPGEKRSRPGQASGGGKVSRSPSSDEWDGASEPASRRSSADITLWSDAELMTPPASPTRRYGPLLQPRRVSSSFLRLRETATSVFGAVKFRHETPPAPAAPARHKWAGCVARRAFLKKIRLRRNVQVPGVMYTDQARAAAVALGEHDIKYSLKNRRFLNRGQAGCWVSEDSSFVAFASHAQLELRRGDPTYAIKLLDRALEFEPRDESCLVNRSKCHLLLGNHEAALKDAETILSQNPRCARAVAQKAESLYAMGEFEVALVFFSRGLRLRPDMAVFSLGVDTATEAIENAVGARAGLDFSAASSKAGVDLDTVVASAGLVSG